MLGRVGETRTTAVPLPDPSSDSQSCAAPASSRCSTTMRRITWSGSTPTGAAAGPSMRTYLMRAIARLSARPWCRGGSGGCIADAREEAGDAADAEALHRGAPEERLQKVGHPTPGIGRHPERLQAEEHGDEERRRVDRIVGAPQRLVHLGKGQ